jgi:hypothetical protein
MEITSKSHFFNNSTISPKFIFKSENHKSGDKCDDKSRFDQEICTAIDDFRWAFNNFSVTVKGTNPKKNV